MRPSEPETAIAATLFRRVFVLCSLLTRHFPLLPPPFSPASGPAASSFNGLHAKSKFLATCATNPKPCLIDLCNESNHADYKSKTVNHKTTKIMQTTKSTSMLLNGPLLLLACTAMLQAEPASSPCTGPTISVHTMNCDDPVAAPQNPDSPETAAPADHVKQALLFNAPAPWKVGFEINNLLGEVPTYTLTREGGDPSIFFISQAPANGHVNQIPELLEAQGKGFLAELKTNYGIKPKTDKFKLEEIVGDTFSGRFIESPVVGEVTQIQFIIGENKGIENGKLWNGHFIGSKEHWAEALAILKALKKND